MRKTINFTKWLWSVALMAVVSLLCGSNVMFADATELADGGVSVAGNTSTADTPSEGIATESAGRENGDDNFYLNEIDQKIVKIRPMATPIDQISRYAKGGPSDSFVVKYYTVGFRSLYTTLSTAVTAMEDGSTTTTLTVADSKIFTQDDTIRVVGVKGVAETDQNGIGKEYSTADATTPDLVLQVVSIEDNNGIKVYAINGNLDSDNKPILVPDIEAGVKLIRLGKACAELDAQTGVTSNLPTPELQFCQNFFCQVEQSTLDKIAKKEVNWTFSDLEEYAIYEMRLGMEQSFLFGAKSMIRHSAKNGQATWTTHGIWWMAGKDIELGEYDSDSGEVVVSDENLVDFCKDAFAGTGIGNKRKILFCGSEMLAALSKIQSDKFRLKETVEHWNLKFKSWETDFGEILTFHHEMFDLNDMADCGFLLDPEYISKRVHLAFNESLLELEKTGQRRTAAKVFNEISCVYLRYAKAHARVQLAAATETETETES